MSRALEALYKHESLLVPRYEGGFDTPFCLTKEFKIIETELKDYEETDNLLCDLCEKFGINNEKDLLKKLQALESIKELFDCGYLQFKYGQIVSAGTNDDSSYPLTKEKNDLLKKVLL